MRLPGPVLRLSSWLRTRKTLGRWALACIPDIHRTARIEPIGRFRYRLRRHRAFWLRHPLTHDRLAFGAIRRLLQPGDTVYDVGANIGLYSRFLIAFGAHRVIAFEPATDNLALLHTNLKLGGIDERVTVMPLGLSDADGEEVLQLDDVMSGTATLDSVSRGEPSEGHRQYGVAGRTERVRVARLDTLVARGEIPEPRLIKVDIEGAEEVFLAGARETILRCRPSVVIEVHGLARAGRVIGVLEGLGYEAFGHTRRNGILTYSRLRPDDPERLERRFDLTHVFAAPDPERLREPIKPYYP